MIADEVLKAVQETHPWITFQVDLSQNRRDLSTLWLALGEATSAVEFIAGIPLIPDLAQELHSVYLAKGALATTAIEGNTLTEEDARAQVEGRLHLPPSKEYLASEIQNILDACNLIRTEVMEAHPKPLTPDLIHQFNRLVLKDVPAEEGAVPGEFRRHMVYVGPGTYRGVPDYLIPQLVQHLCDWLDGPEFSPPNETLRVPYTIIKATVAHLYIAWIHPFGDGNGRTARLVEFFILLSSKFPTLTTQLLSNHYNATRSEYYRQLKHASRSGGDIIPFLAYAARGMADQLKEQSSFIQAQQISIVWENFTRSMLKGSRDLVERRHQLLLDLAKQNGFVKSSEIPELSPRLARLYANRTRKTLTRDLNELEREGLIIRDDKGHFAANVRLLRQFIPQHL